MTINRLVHGFIIVLCLIGIVVPVHAGDFQMISVGDGLTLHKEMFMLPVTYSDKYNQAQTEMVFQLSAKHRMFGTRFYFAYTQISFWQAYDQKNSAPFRETNYNPEIFFRAKPIAFHGGMLGADIGYEHQSNGQSELQSRSWDVVYVSPHFSHDDLLVYLKLRYRIPESDKDSLAEGVGDDNPDITDFLGYNDLHAYYELGRDHKVHAMLRGNLRTGKGAAGLTYCFPVPKATGSSFVIRITHGYGESLVDYKQSLTRVGIGVMFMR